MTKKEILNNQYAKVVRYFDSCGNNKTQIKRGIKALNRASVTKIAANDECYLKQLALLKKIGYLAFLKATIKRDEFNLQNMMRGLK